MMISLRVPKTMVLATAMWGCATATLAASVSEPNSTLQPIVLAQTQAPVASWRLTTVVDEQAYPAYQAGVRRAAAEGPDALRRYVWRTRMIYNFYFNNFAIKE